MMHRAASAKSVSSNGNPPSRQLSIELPKLKSFSQLDTRVDQQESGYVGKLRHEGHDETPKADGSASRKKSLPSRRKLKLWPSQTSGNSSKISSPDWPIGTSSGATQAGSLNDSSSFWTVRRSDRGASGLVGNPSSDTLASSSEARSFTPRTRAKSSFLKRLWSHAPNAHSATTGAAPFSSPSTKEHLHTNPIPTTPPVPLPTTAPPGPALPPPVPLKSPRQRHQQESEARQRVRRTSQAELSYPHARSDRHRHLSSIEQAGKNSLDSQSSPQDERPSPTQRRDEEDQERLSPSLASRRGQPQPIITAGLYKHSSLHSVAGFDGSENSSLFSESPRSSSVPSEQHFFGAGRLTPNNETNPAQKRSLIRVQRSEASLPIIEGSPPFEPDRPAQSRDLGLRSRTIGKNDLLTRSESQHCAAISTPRQFDYSPSKRGDEDLERHDSDNQSNSSANSDMPGGDKGSHGGWRNPFSSSKKKSEESNSAERLRHETSANSLPGRSKGGKVSPEDEREWAAQQIAQQQRAANDARLAGLIPALETATTPKARMSKREEILADRNRLSSFDALTNSNNSGGADQHFSQSPASNSSLDDKDDGEEASCPVCLELLSFRLAGEKPHVVPACGHALHHACFSAVYGPPESVLAAQEMTANGSAGSGRPVGPPGMCGICRKPIVLGGDSARGRPNKAAGMMGVGGAREHRSTHKSRAERDDPLEARKRDQSRDLLSPASPFPSAATQQTEHVFASQDDAPSSPSRHLVTPQIRMRPEYDTLYRKDRTGENGKQNTVCVISIEVPPRRPQPSPEQEELSWYSRFGAIAYEPLEQDAGPDGISREDAKRHRLQSDAPLEKPERAEKAHFPEQQRDSERQEEKARKSLSKETHANDGEDDDDDDEEEAFSFSATPARPQDPYAAVVRDLSVRIQDWKGHSADKFGPLLLYDYIGVRQEPVVRDFYVYLFKEALLCVVEDRKSQRGLGRLMNSERGNLHGSGAYDHSGGAGFGGPGSNEKKTALKLKGRIWIRHIKACRDAQSNPEGQYGLSIKLDDENVDHFVLCFKDPAMREKWRGKFLELLEEVPDKTSRLPATGTMASIAEGPNANDKRRTFTELASPAMPQHGDEGEEAVKSAGAMPVSRRARHGSNHSGKTGSNDKSAQSPTIVDSASQMTSVSSAANTVATRTPSTHSSATAATTPAAASAATAASAAAAPPPTASSSAMGRPFRKVTSEPAPHQQWASSGGLDPQLPLPDLLPHAPIDLVVIFSIPSVSSSSSTPSLSSTTLSSSAALKLRLLKSTLEFVINNLGPRDRLALVAYQIGPQGPVRRTGMLNSSKDRSREKLESFVATIGKTFDSDEDDPFREDLEKLGGSSDRTDTVTAVNVGLDIVLQRKGKNPVTGMILINDTADQPRRGQMDLIMARAEAANVPVHCFGFGKGHDPSSLWLISNHTKGTYTFVEQWFWLRESIAGCVGSLMSVALTDVKIHISVPGDNHFKVRKVSGTSASILAQSGKDVDVELGELRFGECKELFVELEFDFNGLAPLSSVRSKAVRSSAAFKTLYEQGSATDDFFQRLGLQGLSLSDGGNGSDLQRKGELPEGAQFESFVEEVAVLQVDCSYRDPALGTTLKKLSNPSVLTVEVDSVSQDPISDPSVNPTALADPVVTRRRLEILTSDMITRSLLLVSRKHYSQALTILAETRRIVDTVLEAVPIPVAPQSSSLAIANSSSDNSFGSSTIGRRESQMPHLSTIKQKQYHNTTTTTTKSTAKKQRETLHRRTAESLFAILEDLDVLIDGLEGSRSTFERSQRNFGAQQAMALRDQKAWTSRTDTEWAFHRRIDNAPAFAARGDAFAAGLS